MSLKDKISDDLKEAMRAKNALRRTTIRSIRTAILNAEKKGRDEALSDEDILQMIQKEAKQRREAAEQFKKGSRQDLADREEAELAILEEYLPRQLNRGEVAEIVGPVIEEMGVKGIFGSGASLESITTRIKEIGLAKNS